MNKKEKELLRGEFIGLKALIDNKNQGKILDETKNMFLIQTGKGNKKFTKKNHDFTLIKKHQKITINGEKLTEKPEERIKEKWLNLRTK